MFNKKGAEVWVSAVLYFGLGLVLLTIILAAGLPMINKIKDKNIISQTKEVLHTLDASIRDVIRQGPGAQRVLNIQIQRGEFKINQELDEITWQFTSKVAISEIEEDVAEGNIQMKTKKGVEEGTYIIVMRTSYAEFADIEFKEASQILQGNSRMTIKNIEIVQNARGISVPKISLAELQ